MQNPQVSILISDESMISTYSGCWARIPWISKEHEEQQRQCMFFSKQAVHILIIALKASAHLVSCKERRVNPPFHL